MRAHPAADIFPLLEAPELQVLADDIAANGQQEPIVIWDGKILDGRNRSAACKLAGVEPRTRTLPACPSPVAYVMSANLHRRHLLAAQRAAVALDAEPQLAKEAKDRQRAAGEQFGRGHPKGPSRSGTKLSDGAGKATRQAATLAHVGHGSVEQLKAAAKAAPEVMSEVRAGRLKVAEAAAVAALPVESRKTVLAAVADGEKPREAIRQARKAELAAKSIAEPSGRYRVIYADPPWSYGDERAGLAGYEATAAADHYPTMPTPDICAVPVREWADDNAVLFCWATFPLLPDALDVVRSWGFKYKTAFVWAKGRGGGLGHYHDTSCELLIVATRGSCMPDSDKREPQLQQIQRTGKHSQKPDEIRTVIDRLYTHGRRLEMFRRGEAPIGWDIWGNEAG